MTTRRKSPTIALLPKADISDISSSGDSQSGCHPYFLSSSYSFRFLFYFKNIRSVLCRHPSFVMLYCSKNSTELTIWTLLTNGRRAGS